jgi:hypothetical protein
MSWGNSLRSCAGCSAHVLTNDDVSAWVYCPKCRPKFIKPAEEWLASLEPGSGVYAQPAVLPPALIDHQWRIKERDGDDVILFLLGLPEERFWVHTQVWQLLQVPVRTDYGSIGSGR